jgi:predicted AAA+ superfamily ATPase
MHRNSYLQKIQHLAGQFPVVALFGPRQCGKTTLARQYQLMQSKTVHYFDLEDPEDLQRLSEPKTILSSLDGLIIIDEIQIKPDLFPLLRVLVDRTDRKQSYLIFGSASRQQNL